VSVGSLFKKRRSRTYLGMFNHPVSHLLHLQLRYPKNTLDNFIHSFLLDLIDDMDISIKSQVVTSQSFDRFHHAGGTSTSLPLYHHTDCFPAHSPIPRHEYSQTSHSGGVQFVAQYQQPSQLPSQQEDLHESCPGRYAATVQVRKQSVSLQQFHLQGLRCS
jgi:hypothetical protein